MSLGAGALALLGAGSVAFTTRQSLGAASFRQPATLTISILDDGAACKAATTRTATRFFMGRHDNAGVTALPFGKSFDQRIERHDVSGYETDDRRGGKTPPR